MPDDLSGDSIEHALTGRFGRPLKFFDEVDSTNRVALEWAGEGAPEGALVVADHQTEGRGRWGREWLSEPGRALMFSLVLRPQIPSERLGVLSTALGLGCVEGIEMASGLQPRLKWPNDVTVHGRKLAGILVETKSGGALRAGGPSPHIEAVIAGVGLNVVWAPEEMPAEIGASATSISAEMGAEEVPTRAEVLAQILESFETFYAMARSPIPEVLIQLAAGWSDILGKRVRVRYPNGHTLEGVATRLLPSGALEMDVNGSAETVHAGEIERLLAT